MIHIENHHPAIIERDVWESVQELRIHKQRIRKKIKQEFDDEDKRNESFDDKFTCGECGNSFGFARYSNVRRDRYWDKATGEWKQTRSTDATSTSLIWRCNRARDGLVRVCDSKQFTQEYIELNFQHLLIDMLTNNGFAEEYKRVYAELELTEDELKIEASLRKEMEEYYQMLYEAVDEELNARGRDSKRIDSLTESLVHYQVQLKQYEEKRDRQSTLKNEVEWFMKNYSANDFLINIPPDLQGIENTRLGKRILTSDIIDTGLMVEEATFNRELFERLIEIGRVYSDGRVIFKLKAGIEWAAPITYDNYERLVFKRIRIKSLMKYLDRINSPEVTDLLRYCKTPRTSREIHAFLDTNTLEEIMRTVINPLVEMGRLKYTIPEFIQSHDQKYYSE
jgi:ATP-dependent DNA helicase RecG